MGELFDLDAISGLLAVQGHTTQRGFLVFSNTNAVLGSD
jgi:hypothetical protein